MIDLTIRKDGLVRNIARARKQGILIPTFAQMKDPSLIPQPVLDKLAVTGLWDIDPVNLFRINWHNEPKDSGGLFGSPNILEFPSTLTGVPCRIVAMVGKWFPTGCHKVGASFGCLIPELVTGRFDTSTQKAVWPSTGNYCRGGAFNSRLLGVHAIGILPEEMSRERFDWLRSIGAEIIATPGCESNVKEIFDKTKELEQNPTNMVFNQFEQMGNHLWHYEVTGSALAEVFESIRRPGDRFAGACFTTGSAGAIGSGDKLKELYPAIKIGAGEALQCPTLLNNGFGGHRIEGIGDKHVPWIHNVKNTDMVIAIDDNDSQELLRLFNDPTGLDFLAKDLGLDPDFIAKLSWLGISGIANLLCCIKMAKYYEFDKNDVVATLLTDSVDMYHSRLQELDDAHGPYTHERAAVDYYSRILGQKTDNLLELTYTERKRIHNLKYYTWVEQQGKTAEMLNDLWYGTEFSHIHSQAAEIDELITAFNEAVMS